MNEEKINDLFIILEKYLIGLDGYVFTRSDRKYILSFFDIMKLQFEAYKNMRKELKNRIEYTNFKDVEDLEKFKSYLDELMKILNKVGEDNETI